MGRKTVAVDFDGVLHQYEGWKGERHYDLPYSWARDFLERLIQCGYEVVIFTTRARADVYDWLNQYGMADLGLRVEKMPWWRSGGFGR